MPVDFRQEQFVNGSDYQRDPKGRGKKDKRLLVDGKMAEKDHGKMLENIKREDPFSEKGKDPILNGYFLSQQQHPCHEDEREYFVNDDAVPKREQQEKQGGTEKEGRRVNPFSLKESVNFFFKVGVKKTGGKTKHGIAPPIIVGVDSVKNNDVNDGCRCDRTKEYNRPAIKKLSEEKQKQIEKQSDPNIPVAVSDCLPGEKGIHNLANGIGDAQRPRKQQIEHYGNVKMKKDF